MHLVKRLLWHSAARALVGLGLLSVLLVNVGPLDYGAYTGYLATASIFGAAACLGFDRVMLIADPDECRALRRISVLVALGLGVAAAAICWLVSIRFATRDLGPASISAAGQRLIALNGFLQLTGTAAILCTSQQLIRNGRYSMANLCLSLPSLTVLGAQAISVGSLGSSISALAIGAIGGWIMILGLTFVWSIPLESGRAVPVKPVLQRWWKPATIRMATGFFSNTRSQLGYLVIFVSTPFGAELLAAVRLFDTGSSALSGIVERSWGLVLASIGCTEGPETLKVRSGALIDDFSRWVRRLAIVCLPGLGIAAFVGRHVVSDRWVVILDAGPPLLIAATIAAQVAWLEKLFEYERRFMAGFWTEVLIMLSLLTVYAALLPITSSVSAGALVIGAACSTAMLVRSYACMKHGVSRITSRALLVTVATVSWLAGLAVWIVRVVS